MDRKTGGRRGLDGGIRLSSEHTIHVADPTEETNTGLSKGAVIGVAVGAVIVLLLIALVIVMLVVRRKREHRRCS